MVDTYADRNKKPGGGGGVDVEKIAEETERSEAERKRKKRKTALIIALSVLAVLVALAVLLPLVILPGIRYAKATELYHTGEYEGEDGALAAQDGDPDSAERADDICEQHKEAGFRNAAVGDYVLFGAYEQDNDSSNGAEDIEWLVLFRDGEGILAVSRYVLDYMQYTSSTDAVSWEECSLCKWLNDTFYNSAFREEEQQRIRNVIGNVFLLSTSDAHKYFGSDTERRCAPTAYAIARGAMTSSTYQVEGQNTCGWWLRNVYRTNFNAATITIEGAVSTLDVDLWLAYYGVRPALWINTGGE